jgi:MFS superfamily sulfate permease-like transporter
VLLFLFSRIPRCPAAPLVLGGAAIVGWATTGRNPPTGISFAVTLPNIVVPSWSEVWRSLEIAVIPQLSLTLTNAVIVTASLSRQLFPETGAVASEQKLALSSGLANVLLCPFGAMPMCHGAGGLQAQYRFGARTGLAPIILGIIVLVLAVGFADHAATIFGIIPIGCRSAADPRRFRLGISRRLFDGRPSCWWVIGVTALVTVTVNPAVGLVLGWITEFIRAAVVRRVVWAQQPLGM